MLKFDRTSRQEAKARFAARKAELGFFGALKSEGGAIDLASIMVGVIVIGIIAGVIAATVFAVIPWSQNNAAQQSLDAVKTAEGVQYAQSADGGTAVYGGTSDSQADDNGVNLTDSANASNSVLLQSSATVKVVTSADGQHFIAISKSATGNVYAIDDSGAGPVLIDGDDSDSVAEGQAADAIAAYTGTVVPTFGN